MSDNSVRLKCIEVEQPIGTFYIAAAPWKDVLEIAYADIRRIEQRDIEKLVGIQRELNSKRVKEIRQYVSTVDAAFPTSIILAIRATDAKFDRTRNELVIRRREDVASIIDGQHRIAGLEGFDGPKFELNITVFIDMDVQDQAMTFATINLAQTKVNKSLVYDLFDFQKARSPQKTAHNIARLLNRENGSPLSGRIKILGKAMTDDPLELITQATFVESLLPHITKNPLQDRDDLRRKRKLSPATEIERETLVLRQLFLEDKDAEIAKVVWNLFEGVRAKWPEAWESAEKGNVLPRSTGFRALMKFLGPLYRAHSDARGRLPVDAVRSALRGIRIGNHEFTTERFPPGASGESRLFGELMDGSKLT